MSQIKFLVPVSFNHDMIWYGNTQTLNNENLKLAIMN